MFVSHLWNVLLAEAGARYLKLWKDNGPNVHRPSYSLNLQNLFHAGTLSFKKKDNI